MSAGYYPKKKKIKERLQKKKQKESVNMLVNNIATS